MNRKEEIREEIKKLEKELKELEYNDDIKLLNNYIGKYFTNIENLNNPIGYIIYIKSFRIDIEGSLYITGSFIDIDGVHNINDTYYSSDVILEKYEDTNIFNNGILSNYLDEDDCQGSVIDYFIETILESTTLLSEKQVLDTILLNTEK